MNVFCKESESKIKIVYVFFFLFFFFFLVKGVGGGEGKGMARVSECLTMDPNKKNVFRGGRGWGEVAGGGARVNEFLLLRIHI